MSGSGKAYPPGWRAGMPHTPETRAMLSAWQTGRLRSDETRRKLSESKKKKPDAQGRYECATCHGRFLPAEMTNRRVYCLPCNRAYMRKRYADIPAEREAAMARQKKPERRAYARDYMRRWREENKERFQEVRRLWNDANREKIRAQDRKKHAQRSRATAGGFVSEADWFKARAQNNFQCFYCGGKSADPDNDMLHMDHFHPIARGGAHDRHNIMPACKSCNSRKHAMDPIAFLHRMEKEMPDIKQNRTPKEKAIKAEILLALGMRDDMFLWNNPVGLAKPIFSNRNVKFGVKGAADIIGVQRRFADTITVINPDGFTPYEKRERVMYGQGIAIETKTDVGRQSPAQKAFERRWTELGGIYILARSVADVLAVLGPDSPVTI